jgi:hypothetical protein
VRLRRTVALENVCTGIAGVNGGADTVTDTLVTPFGNVDLSSLVASLDAILPLNPADAFGAGLDVATSAASEAATSAASAIDPLGSSVCNPDQQNQTAQALCGLGCLASDVQPPPMTAAWACVTRLTASLRVNDANIGATLRIISPAITVGPLLRLSNASRMTSSTLAASEGA